MAYWVVAVRGRKGLGMGGGFNLGHWRIELCNEFDEFITPQYGYSPRHGDSRQIPDQHPGSRWCKDTTPLAH